MRRKGVPGHWRIRVSKHNCAIGLFLEFCRRSELGREFELREPATATLTYLVPANPGPDRSVTMTIGGVPYQVEQESDSIAGLSLIGSMPHMAAKENWTTTFTLVNKGASAARSR